jgi:hypothetical protein
VLAIHTTQALAGPQVPHPPATKCGHDFAKAGPCAATGAPSGSFGGSTSPSSRDEGGSVCSGCAVSSRRLRGREAWSKAGIEVGAWGEGNAQALGGGAWCCAGREEQAGYGGVLRGMGEVVR